MDGRRTKTYHKSSPCHFVTSELIKSNTRSIINLTAFAPAEEINEPSGIHNILQQLSDMTAQPTLKCMTFFDPSV